MNFMAKNHGYIPVDNLRLDFYLNEGETKTVAQKLAKVK